MSPTHFGWSSYPPEHLVNLIAFNSAGCQRWDIRGESEESDEHGRQTCK